MKNTKKALLLSVMSLLLCVSMLVGTTFAWFTDSVSTGKNVIAAGNLDIELYYKLDAKNEWSEVNTNTELFDDAALWEPGYTQVVYLKVLNAGSLALKYQLGVNIISETQGKNVEGKMFKLSDYIEFDAIETDAENFYANRDAARKAVTDSKIISTGYSKASELEKTGDAEYVALVVYMPETVGNEANYRDIQPKITLGLNLLATQQTYEKDSFDELYDDKAEYLPEWDGEGTEVPEEENGVITISSAGELAALSESVSNGTSYNGKTIVLSADLNLAGLSWTPIGACNSDAYFQGTFDGQGHTIYGLNVDNSTDTYMYSTAGLFGWIDSASATIKNINIDGATVKGSHWVGGLVGYMTGTIENCTVSNSVVMGYNVNDDANGDKVGGLVGYMNAGSGKLEGNTVSNTTVAGYRDVAGLAGAVATSNSVKNNTVKDSTVAYQADYAAAIVSAKTAVVVDDTNKAVNVIVVKGEQVAPGVVEVAASSYEVTGKEGLLNVNTIIAESSTGEGRGIKVKLLADVDLTGETWKPIDRMWIDFDGNGHTISNLTTEAWKAGFFGYLGGGSIKNLTLENVNVTGAQAGAFAGSIEGTIDNCVLKGTNTITWAEKHQYDDPNAGIETWSGIGAITGVTQPCTVNATIAEGATVKLNYGAITTEAPYVDQLTGYIAANKGIVVNNGTIIVVASDTASLQDALATGGKIVLSKDLELDENTVLVVASGTSAEIDLNGYTLSVENTTTATHNFMIDVKGGVLTLKNGTVSMEHTGTNMGWNGATTVIDVTAGGVLNLEDVVVENKGGTDMNFAVHLNNWGEATLNADNCVFKAPYCGVRVFNSGPNMNNVKITNSTMTGETRAFWVHNYASSDMGGKTYSGSSVAYDKAVVDARLNLDIYNNNNTFQITGTAKSPIRYGFNEVIYFDANGNQVF